MMAAFLGIFAIGCTAGRAFQSVDLSTNLTAETLQRYESEWKEAQAEGRAEHMVQLERSNWWPLGLIAYHRDCTVMRMEGPDGPVYHVSSGHGFGPLCLLYTRSTHATFTAKGERVNWMRMQHILHGMLAMGDETDAKLTDGREEWSSCWGFLHHIFNVHSMNGHRYYSLISMPNPLGIMTEGAH
jgi:hypothetical protein